MQPETIEPTQPTYIPRPGKRKAGQRTTRKYPKTQVRKPTPLQKQILAVKDDHPDLSTREVAAIADTTHAHVVITLKRYGIPDGVIADFESHQVNILTGIQHRLLSSITDEDIKKTPLGSRILGFAQIFDKIRLLRGESTENVGLMVGSLKQLQEMRRNKKSIPRAGLEPDCKSAESQEVVDVQAESTPKDTPKE